MPDLKDALARLIDGNVHSAKPLEHSCCYGD